MSARLQCSLISIQDLFNQTLERLAAGLPATAPEFGRHHPPQQGDTARGAQGAAYSRPRSIPVLVEGEPGTGKELFGIKKRTFTGAISTPVSR